MDVSLGLEGHNYRLAAFGMYFSLHRVYRRTTSNDLFHLSYL